MPDPIARFFGRHIDLSKIVSVSDYDELNGVFVVEFQLRDEPMAFWAPSHVVERDAPEAHIEALQKQVREFRREHAALIEAWREVANA